jgi:hypothetical protein
MEAEVHSLLITFLKAAILINTTLTSYPEVEVTRTAARFVDLTV